MRMIRISAVLLGTALAAAACAGGPQHVDGFAQPAGAATIPPASATATPAPATSAPTSTPATPATSAATGTSPTGTASSEPAASTRPVTPLLGPNGLGELQLGMSRAEAEATGLITGYRVEDFTGNCGVSKIRGTDATVYFTPGLGLSSIAAYGSVRTPRGIRLGSTVAAVRKAYPDWDFAIGDEKNGWGWVDHYRIDVKDGKVSYLALAAEGQRCIE